MDAPRSLLALPTVHEIGELLQSIFQVFDMRVRLPEVREPPEAALEHARDDVAGVLACCDHPPLVLDGLRQRAALLNLPMVLFSSRMRADELEREATRLALPWLDLTESPERIVGLVRSVIGAAP